MQLVANIKKKQIKELPAVYFALVMATGIVSIGCHLVGLTLLSNILFYLNNFQYCILFAASAIKLLFYRDEASNSFSDSSKAPGFLTFVAGSCVLGVQYVVVRDCYVPAIVFWWIGFAAWLIIVYGFLLVLITKPFKQPLEEGINGGWLLLVVATQSLSILASKLFGYLFPSAEFVNGLSCMAFFLGVFFYLLLIPILFFRMTFDPLKPQNFTPPYWVLMGAAAITSLAGATLLQSLEGTSFTDLAPVIKSITLAACIIATWWIPLLIMLEIWRHLFKHIPITYLPANWDLVFTVGMYSASTFQLAHLLTSPLLLIVVHIILYIALLIWIITFISMLKSTVVGLTHG